MLENITDPRIKIYQVLARKATLNISKVVKYYQCENAYCIPQCCINKDITKLGRHNYIQTLVDKSAWCKCDFKLSKR
jgi:hypothetical protein